jgi:tetratricopeptide (TPR) repeat protein
LEPFNAIHYFDLGRLHFIEGHREEAIAVLRQAMHIEPNFLPAREWLIRAYLESHEIAMADHEYREIADRRERLLTSARNAFETHFLSVDINALKAALAEAKRKI